MRKVNRVLDTLETKVTVALPPMANLRASAAVANGLVMSLFSVSTFLCVFFSAIAYWGQQKHTKFYCVFQPRKIGMVGPRPLRSGAKPDSTKLALSLIRVKYYFTCPSCICMIALTSCLLLPACECPMN